MVNLLPLKEKKYLRREYHYRLSILACKGIFILTIVFAFLLFPTRVRLALSERAADRRLEILETGQASNLEREVRAGVSDINQKLSIFTFKPEWSFSKEVFEPILDNLDSDSPAGQAGVRLNSVFMERSATGVVAKLRGRAVNRDELLEFRRRLETAPGFAQVNLPISNFVKGQDIEFSLDILLSEKK